jgi:hypothetical protein
MRRKLSRVTRMETGGPREPPAAKAVLLIARTLGRRFRLAHLLLHLRLDGVEIEARAPLHRRTSFG